MGTNKVENGNKSWHETGMINSTPHTAEMLCLFIRIAWLKSRCLINKGKKWIFVFKMSWKNDLQRIRTACVEGLYILDFIGPPRQLLDLYLYILQIYRRRLQINEYHPPRVIFILRIFFFLNMNDHRSPNTLLCERVIQIKENRSGRNRENLTYLQKD